MSSAKPVETRQEFSYGHGRAPKAVLLLWAAFIAWFVWFVYSKQLPELEKSFPPGGAERATGPEAPAPK
jgi:hypothetical protein